MARPTNMGHLRSLDKLTCEVNPKHLGDWPFRIGQYMLNFSALEVITYQYLNALEASRVDFDANLDRPFPARVRRIRSLITDSNLAQTDKDEIDSLWQVAIDLAVWRNRIAHNPVLPTWKTSNPDTAPPDLIGIPDIKQLKLGNTSDSLSLEGLTELVEGTVNVALHLTNAAKRLA